MSFFEGIGFENFRVIGKKINFDLAPITILTGANNSGKSSVINGIKLLKENFKDVKKPLDVKTDLDLENMVNRIIESGPLLENYGNLGQFIKKGSDKEEFTFSFRRKLYSTEDDVDIAITIGLNKNSLKNGKIIKVVMQSIKTEISIFQIYERLLNKVSISPTYEKVIKIDFQYFKSAFELRLAKSLEYYDSYNKLLLECKKIVGINNFVGQINSKIESFNLKFSTALTWHFEYEDYGMYSADSPYEPNVNDFCIKTDPYADGPGYLISEKTLQLIKSQQVLLPGIYDFSFLWKDSEENKALFEKSILSYYKLPFEEAYIKFNNDIVKFISDLEWCVMKNLFSSGSGINNIINTSNYSNGIGFKRFLELFTTLTDIRYHAGLNREGENSSFEILNDQIEDAINNNLDFYRLCFKPFLELADKISSANFFNDELHFMNFPFDKCIETQSEILIADMVREVFRVFQISIGSLSGFEFLSSFRIISKRMYSFADHDQFPHLIKRIENLDDQKRHNAYKFINRWLKTFGIADNLDIELVEDTGNFKPYFIKNGHRLLMADLGYGTSQILPLLLKLVPTNTELDHLYDPKDGRFNSVVVIEEPEANLHPALQSKLADLFVEAINYGTQIIIETHSEYLIRKLQYLTAKKEVLPEFIQLYYFNNPDNIPEGEEQVKKININKDGSLTDNFGKGFFDEADNIALELFLINQSQRN